MSKIRLKEMIQDLRSELMEAKVAGAEEALKFLVEDVEIEVEVLASKNQGRRVV
ncbi:MAG: trypco2 family protein [Methylococcales bacterium]